MSSLKVQPRRKFLQSLALGAAAIGAAGIATPLNVSAGGIDAWENNDPEEWMKKINGKHRIVYDVTEPHHQFPFAWPRVFLLTNEATGTPPGDCSVVVILRHNAIPFAMDHHLWEKYKFGEMFQVTDVNTKQTAEKNPFWKPAPGTYKFPGFGAVSIGINELQESGVQFLVCDAALTVYSAVAAGNSGNAADVKKEWVAGVLPGIHVVPSGVWAVSRAQEKGCGYCFVR
jgi:intracellular sulfur oxidation DsrE/DsrF family protein